MRFSSKQTSQDWEAHTYRIHKAPLRGCRSAQQLPREETQARWRACPSSQSWIRDCPIELLPASHAERSRVQVITHAVGAGGCRSLLIAPTDNPLTRLPRWASAELFLYRVLCCLSKGTGHHLMEALPQ